MDMRLSWLSKSCTSCHCVLFNFGPVCLLFGLIYDIVRAEYQLFSSLGDRPTAIYRYASHHIERGVLRGTLRAHNILIYHTFVHRAPVEMMSAKTSLANTPGTFRANIVSNCTYQQGQLTMVWSLHSNLRFDLKLFAVPLLPLPSSQSSLFSAKVAGYS